MGALTKSSPRRLVSFRDLWGYWFLLWVTKVRLLCCLKVF